MTNKTKKVKKGNCMGENTLSHIKPLIEAMISSFAGPIFVGMLTALYFDLLARKPYLKSF